MDIKQNETASSRGDPRRRRRVKRLKKMIIAGILTLIIVPSVLCAVFAVRTMQLQRQLDRLQQAALSDVAQAGEPAETSLKAESPVQTETTATVRSENAAAAKPAADAQTVSNNAPVTADALTDAGTGRKVYLTFDDGPSRETDEILDVLEKYRVKATFFVVAKTDRQYDGVYRRIVSDGHTLGMHSYSHNYATLYASADSFQQDLDKLQNFLYDKTGVSSRYYRFPGGSSNAISRLDIRSLIQVLQARGIEYYDWNVSAGDAASHESAKQIVDTTLQEIAQWQGSCIVLLHDADDKKTTVEALPKLIEGIQAMDDTELLPLTEDTVPIHHKLEK